MELTTDQISLFLLLQVRTSVFLSGAISWICQHNTRGAKANFFFPPQISPFASSPTQVLRQWDNDVLRAGLCYGPWPLAVTSEARGRPPSLHSTLWLVNSFKRSLSAVVCQVPGIISNPSLTAVHCTYIPSNGFPFCSVLLIPKSAWRICLGSLPEEGCWLPRGSPHIWASSPLTLTHACSHMSDESKSLEKSGQILLRLLYSAALVEVRITDLFKKHLQLNLNLISSGSKVNGIFFILTEL